MLIGVSKGSTGCVGKALALQEMRMVIVALLRRFDFVLAPSWDAAAWEREQKDYFVIQTGVLPVIVRPKA